MLAYALQRFRGSRREPSRTTGTGEVRSQSAVPIAAMSVDSNRVATLYRDGSVKVMSSEGDRESSFAAWTGSRDRASRRHCSRSCVYLAVSNIYSAATGTLTKSWHVPANARSVDVSLPDCTGHCRQRCLRTEHQHRPHRTPAPRSRPGGRSARLARRGRRSSTSAGTGTSGSSR